MTTETIAVIGGTGNIGYGLALRWAEKGHRVLIGSRAGRPGRGGRERSSGRGSRKDGGAGEIAGLVNPEAAAEADLVAVTVAVRRAAAPPSRASARVVRARSSST